MPIKNSSAQLRVVLVMETILRLRRTSTLVLFLVLCAIAFMLMPEAGTAGTVFLIGQRRVILNSAATSLTSAVMGGMLFSLAGFYLISNSVARDLNTGVGRLIASTPLSSALYLAGKLFGNILYLTVIAFVYMVACMAMHLLRGEMALEPTVYLATFGIMFLPLIPVVATIALTFECVLLLSGRIGDVLYFLLWISSLSLTAAIVAETQARSWLLLLDFSGVGFFIKEVITVLGARDFTIGYTSFDKTLPAVLFPGLKWIPDIVLYRAASVLLVLPMFGIAWAAFTRFDPGRRRAPKRVGKNLIGRLQRTIAFKWLFAPRIGWPAGPTSLVKAVLLDLRLTMALSPIIFPLALLSFILSILAPVNLIRSTFLPVMFFVLVLAVASISTRDRAVNAAQFVFSAPIVREKYVLLKFISAFMVALTIGLIPLIRIGVGDAFGAASLLNGMLFITAAATCLGILTNTPKAFTATFLLFLYVAVGSKSAAEFDLAGWQMTATPYTLASYAAASLLMLVVAWSAERLRMRKNER